VARGRFWRVVALVVTPLLVLGIALAAGPGNSLFGSTPASSTRSIDKACTALATNAVDTTQRFVAGFDVDVPAVPSPGAPSPAPTTVAIAPPMTQADFTKSLSTTRSRLDSLGCDLTKFRAKLGAGLRHVQGKGVLAEALVRQLRVSLAGKLPDGPVTRHVTSHADLDQVLAEVPDGSTVVLAAGVYSRSQPLVVLRNVTVAGAGRDTTTLASAATGVAVLVMGGVHATFRDLAISIAGSVPASGIVAGAGSTLSVTGARVTGAHSDGHGRGGSAVLVAGDAAPARGRPRTSVSLVDSELSGNDAAGLAVAGVPSTSVIRSTFAHNGECGVCFIGGSGGTVQGSTFDSNAVGIAVTATAHPVITGNVFRRGRFAVQVSDQSKPRVVRNTIREASGAALLYLGTAGGTVIGNRCDRDRYDLVVRRGGHPAISGGTCRTTQFG
jgi:hypothetical protein